jgi:hypothetical protein
MLLIRDIDDKK